MEARAGGRWARGAATVTIRHDAGLLWVGGGGGAAGGGVAVVREAGQVSARRHVKTALIAVSGSAPRQ